MEEVHFFLSRLAHGGGADFLVIYSPKNNTVFRYNRKKDPYQFNGSPKCGNGKYGTSNGCSSSEHNNCKDGKYETGLSLIRKIRHAS